MTANLIERRLASHRVGERTLLDVVEEVRDGNRRVTLFFFDVVTPDEVIAPGEAVARAALAVNGASCLTYELPEDAELDFTIAGQGVRLTAAPAETGMLARTNALAAVRNGERAELVLDWLEFHADLHGMTGAVILDRARPETDTEFRRELAAGLQERLSECRVVLLASDEPLGKPGQPPEAHPFCVPEAPGKDRMQVPDPEPWHSPLGVGSIYEIMRARFLAEARAVANLDVHDLAPRGDVSIFDAAVAAEGGLVTLNGRHCFPWRLRKGVPVHFADHLCVQFDSQEIRRRWCIAPARAPADAVWRMVRVANATADPGNAPGFFRFMALRHPAGSVSRLVPKTSLVESADLLSIAEDRFARSPVRMPEIAVDTQTEARGRRAIVTTMKNEGPFILEWLAYHRAIGFDDVLVYTNDCDDGSDSMLQLLERKGYVQHRDNPYREFRCKPQHAALRAADGEALIRQAAWVTCIDVDEYINIKTGDGTLDALFAAVPDANMIAMTWRLFGNGDMHRFEDRPVTEQFRHCAPEFSRKPHQAWGFKTLFRNIGLFKKLGVHRPKGLQPQLWEEVIWVNGSGQPLPRDMYRNAWRSTASTYGYDLVQLNHYAVRSAESFLVKRDRGRVNHVDREQGLAYWFRMNNNAMTDASIRRNLPRMKEELARLMSDPEIAAAHAYSVGCHRAKIEELLATPDSARFYAELTSPRMEKLSRLHAHFGANVFLSGPQVVPDAVVARDPGGQWGFTVEMPLETQH